MKKFTFSALKKNCTVFALAIASTFTASGQSYCAASGPLCGTPDNSFITSLTFDAFSNSTVCGGSGYSNFTSSVISVVRGSNYSISISEGGVSGQDIAGVWIDWNRDGNMGGTDELIPMTGTGLTPFTGSVLVPSGAVLGNTRMRIRVLFAPDGPPDPCGNTAYGEVEDYTINVLNCSPAPATPGTISGQTSICAGSSSNGYSIAAVSGADTYTWTVPSGMTITSGQGTTSVTISVGAASGTISVTASNNCGASAPKTKAITVSPNPTANAGSDKSVCPGKGVQLSASGGTTYSWSPVTGLSNANISNPVASPASMIHYTVTVSNSSGCSAKDETIVNMHPATAANAGTDLSICPGAFAQLNASGGAAYQWSSSTGLSDPAIADPFASPAATISYTVTVTDANGCSAQDDMTVTVHPAATANAGSDKTICPGTSATLNASGGSSYAWSPSTGLSCSNCQNPVTNPSGNMTYSVTVTDANGCSATDNVSVSLASAVVASAGADVMICKGFNTQLGASGGLTYNWAPSAGLSNPTVSNPVANPTVTTTYSVLVGSADGCYGADDVTVTVDPCTGVEDQAADMGLQVVPNPSAGPFYVISSGASIRDVQIMNIQGEVVYSDDVSTNKLSENKVRVDVQDLPKGIYFLKVISQDKTSIQKVIKQ